VPAAVPPGALALALPGELPEAADEALPDGPPEAPCVSLVALSWRLPVILQSAGSVACTLLSQRSPMSFDFAFDEDG
jgi:hypothetical protein